MMPNRKADLFIKVSHFGIAQSFSHSHPCFQMSIFLLQWVIRYPNVSATPPFKNNDVSVRAACQTMLPLLVCHTGK